MDFNVSIKEAKDYQLQACMNKMKDLYKDCNDNLTGEIALTLQHKCKKELELRGVEPKYY